MYLINATIILNTRQFVFIRLLDPELINKLQFKSYYYKIIML